MRRADLTHFIPPPTIPRNSLVNSPEGKILRAVEPRAGYESHLRLITQELMPPTPMLILPR